MNNDDEPLNSIETDEINILNFWKEHRIFDKSINQTKGSTQFRFFDGPPFANGQPHYGHILSGTIKDVVPRYKTMKGFYVERRFGWDCHGLPVENEVEKQLNIENISAIESIGVDHFNKLCKDVVSQTTDLWEVIVERTGRWVDMQNCWKTMDMSFMESVWWVFAQLYKKGLIYEGYKVMPFSWKLGTPISNFEASQNYKVVKARSLYVKFRLKDFTNTFFVAWTTTPWTLTANLALAVNPNLQYALFSIGNEKFWMSCKSLEKFKDRGLSIEKVVLGKELEGLMYEPVFDFATNLYPNAFRVIASEFVLEDDGTSIVHMAPAFGEVDFDVCKSSGLNPFCTVDSFGYFESNAGFLSKKHFSESYEEILRFLNERSFVFAKETIDHRFPFCWRTDTPLIYKVTKTWFLNVEKIKDQIIENNKAINWVPNHIKFGRFGNWLEGAKDWAISRNRFWGTPIPLWRSEDGRECIAIDSVKELESLSGKTVTDLHKEYVDNISFVKDGMLFERVPEVFDCWFESGSMPFAHVNYPISGVHIDSILPADFIAEGIDQTRGWFYTLNVISTAILNKPAFKNVIVNGTVLAEDGNKMSKRLKNYPDAIKIIKKYGADALRLYLLRSSAVKGENLSFSEDGVDWVVKQVILPLKSVLGFFKQHCNENEDICLESSIDRMYILDKWILSKLNSTILGIDEAMSQYHLYEAPILIESFIDDLTNWYIRRSRQRFWDSKSSYKKHFCVLKHVLIEFSKVIAPLVPFIAEMIYKSCGGSKESVHLENFPKPKSVFINSEIEEGMLFIRSIANVGHGLRKEHGIRVRQPLNKVFVASREYNKFLLMHGDVLCDELNCSTLEVCEDSFFISKKAKPNFKELGKRLPSFVKELKPLIEQMSKDQIEELINNGSIKLGANGISIFMNEVIVDLIPEQNVAAACGENFSVMLDTEIDSRLLEEGIVRECISKINALKRMVKFSHNDKAEIIIDGSKDSLEHILKNSERICSTCNLRSIKQKKSSEDSYKAKMDALDSSMLFTVYLV